MQTPRQATAADRQSWVATVAKSECPMPRARVGAALFASRVARQTDHQPMQNGDHGACDHDCVKVAALLYGFDQSRRIFRLYHFSRQYLLAKPRPDETPQRRTGQSHHAECGEIHSNYSGRNGNEMADHRQKARKENAPCCITTNPSFGPL